MVVQTAAPVFDRSDSLQNTSSDLSLGNRKVNNGTSKGSLSIGLSLHGTVQEEYTQVVPSEVVVVSSPSVTGAQVSREFEKAAKENVMILELGDAPVRRWREVRRATLAKLPKARISTAFEPHLRHLAVKKMQSLMREFRSSIGLPEASTIREELRITLLETYRRATVSAETRSFATAISMLQDFLRPHWSTLPIKQLDDVNAQLSWLDSQSELNPGTLGRFYRNLAAVLGTRMSLQAESEEDEALDDAAQ
jgi:hypothetical protein